MTHRNAPIGTAGVAVAPEPIPPPLRAVAGWPWYTDPPLEPSVDESRIWPRITIVTPSYNQAPFLEATIRSVLLQGYPNLQYIVMDGGSTDGSVEILRHYAGVLSHWQSAPDRGHASAVNGGFALATGDVMGWLNSDDMYHPGALRSIARIFDDCPAVRWVQALASFWSADGDCVRVEPRRPWSRSRVLYGDYAWIQQESTFWRRSLWDAAGPLDESVVYALDFELWIRFFRHAPLHSADVLAGGFRLNPASRSRRHMNEYVREAESALARELAAESFGRRALLRLARRLGRTRSGAELLRWTALRRRLIATGPTVSFDESTGRFRAVH
jgi:glycosyltransferase involved in cell wall biosynthesis